MVVDRAINMPPGASKFLDSSKVITLISMDSERVTFSFLVVVRQIVKIFFEKNSWHSLS